MSERSESRKIWTEPRLESLPVSETSAKLAAAIENDAQNRGNPLGGAS